MPLNDRLCWLHNSGSQQACHTAPALRLLVPSSLQEYCHFFFFLKGHACDMCFVLEDGFNVVMTPACLPVSTASSVPSSLVGFHVAAFQSLPPYGCSSRKIYFRGRVLPRPAASSPRFRLLPWRLYQGSHPREAIRYFEGHFRRTSAILPYRATGTSLLPFLHVG
jgi:hypothetical protein